MIESVIRIDMEVGDIYYARAQYTGCSYHYEFVEVIKITKSGKLRVRRIRQKEIDDPDNKNNFYISERRVIPIPVALEVRKDQTVSFLLTKYKTGEEFWSPKTRLFYEKYDDRLMLYNHTDHGD